MSESPVTAALTMRAAASASLRETAKWLVGGVTATAVGIFAGSSLTNLGSLDFTEDAQRLSIVILGLILGFSGLAAILAAAIRVLTVEGFSFRALAEAQHGSLGVLLLAAGALAWWMGADTTVEDDETDETPAAARLRGQS